MRGPRSNTKGKFMWQAIGIVMLIASFRLVLSLIVIVALAPNSEERARLLAEFRETQKRSLVRGWSVMRKIGCVIARKVKAGYEREPNAGIG